MLISVLRSSWWDKGGAYLHGTMRKKDAVQLLGSIDPMKLTGPELLRALVHDGAYRVFASCKCGVVLSTIEAHILCPYGTCKGLRLPVDAAWWEKAPRRALDACKRDRNLLPALKGEREAHYGKLPLQFPAPFACLSPAWARVRPAHRPFDQGVHHRRSNLVSCLWALGFSDQESVDLLTRVAKNQMNEKEYAESLRAKREAHLNKYVPVGAPHWARNRYEARKDLEARARRVFGFSRTGDALSLSDLESARVCARDAKVSDAAELRRSVKWDRGQHRDPMRLLRGERVRGRDHREEA